MRWMDVFRFRPPSRRADRRWMERIVLGALVALALGSHLGCETKALEEAPENEAAETAPKQESPVEDLLPEDWQPPPTTVLSEREEWSVCHSGGKKIGYGKVAIRDVERRGSKLVQIEGFQQVSIARFGTQSDLEIRFQSTETPDGRLVDFWTRAPMGPMPVVCRGRVQGDRLLLRTTMAGKSRTSSLKWSKDYGGLYAREQSLANKPMEPGEKRTLKALLPVFNQVATIQLEAKNYETVDLLTGAHELLRIEQTVTVSAGILGTQTLKETLWTDRTGEALKSYQPMLKVTTYAATKELALDRTDVASLDVGWNLTVKVDRRLERPHDTRRIRYRVHLEEEDPAATFVTGPYQQLKSIDAHTAELTVYGRRPGMAAREADAASDRPTAADRRPNSIIQSEDPAIVAMARKAAPEEKDLEKLAVALEKHVSDAISQADYSQAFATAAEVAKTGRGDCTEHAVLLAALCRARGIPARVAIGLVYIESSQAFGYHAWTEAYVGGRWIGLDATRPHGGTSAAYLKVSHSSLEGASAYSSLLPIVQLAGRLQIEILEAEQ